MGTEGKFYRTKRDLGPRLSSRLPCLHMLESFDSHGFSLTERFLGSRFKGSHSFVDLAPRSTGTGWNHESVRWADFPDVIPSPTPNPEPMNGYRKKYRTNPKKLDDARFLTPFTGRLPQRPWSFFEVERDPSSRRKA